MAALFGYSSKSRSWPLLIKVPIAIAILVGGFFMLHKAGQLSDILNALEDARGGWIVVGLITTALSFIVAGFTQYAAGNWQGSFHKVHILQWAGNFLNRFLPFGVATVALTALHYRKQGRKPAEALTVATLPTIIGYSENVLLAAVLIPLSLTHLITSRHITFSPLWFFVAVIFAWIVVFVFYKFYSRRIRKFIRDARGGLSSIKKPRQLAVLIFGSLASTLLLSTSLLVATLAMGATLDITDVLALYLLTVFASVVIPTPGGVGGTEAALIAGLTSFGLGFSTAVSITLIFRLMTFWAPLVPSGIALHFFRKQGS